MNDIVFLIREYHLAVMISVWVIAFAIGFIVVYVWKKGMNTAHLKTQADAYIIPGSLDYKLKKDRFLFSTVTKTRRQTSSNSGGRRR